eukprot:g3739.t1
MSACSTTPAPADMLSNEAALLSATKSADVPANTSSVNLTSVYSPSAGPASGQALLHAGPSSHTIMSANYPTTPGLADMLTNEAALLPASKSALSSVPSSTSASTSSAFAASPASALPSSASTLSGQVRHRRYRCHRNLSWILMMLLLFLESGLISASDINVKSTHETVAHVGNAQIPVVYLDNVLPEAGFALMRDDLRSRTDFEEGDANGVAFPGKIATLDWAVVDPLVDALLASEAVTSAFPQTIFEQREHVRGFASILCDRGWVHNDLMGNAHKDSVAPAAVFYFGFSGTASAEFNINRKNKENHDGQRGTGLGINTNIIATTTGTAFYREKDSGLERVSRIPRNMTKVEFCAYFSTSVACSDGKGVEMSGRQQNQQQQQQQQQQDIQARRQQHQRHQHQVFDGASNTMMTNDGDDDDEATSEGSSSVETDDNTQQQHQQQEQQQQQYDPQLFEQMYRVLGVPNRLVVYPSDVLHSAWVMRGRGAVDAVGDDDVHDDRVHAPSLAAEGAPPLLPRAKRFLESIIFLNQQLLFMDIDSSTASTERDAGSRNSSNNAI